MPTPHTTYDDKVVAPVALATLVAGPVLVPDVSAVQLHVALSLRLALLLGHATLGDVILLKGSLGEVRLTAPTDLCAADILIRFAGLNRIEALLCVARLVGAHIAFQTFHEVNCNRNVSLHISLHMPLVVASLRCGLTHLGYSDTLPSAPAWRRANNSA